MNSSARRTAPQEVPPGTHLALNAYLPASLGEAADHSAAGSRRYVAHVGWEADETYVDRVAPFESGALCEGWYNAPAAVEQGRAAGIAALPARDAGTSGEGQGEPCRLADPDRGADHEAVGGRRCHRFRGLTEAGGVMTTMRRASLRQLPGRIGRVLRYPAKYVGRLDFCAFQALFLPVLVTGTALITLYAGLLR